MPRFAPVREAWSRPYIAWLQEHPFDVRPNPDAWPLASPVMSNIMYLRPASPFLLSRLRDSATVRRDLSQPPRGHRGGQRSRRAANDEGRAAGISRIGDGAPPQRHVSRQAR